MSKMDQSGSGESGNTGSHSPPTEKECRNLFSNWFFTLNNYNDSDISNLISSFKLISKKYVFQEEIGENKTPHLQGCVAFKKRKRLSSIKKINNNIHWEVARNWDACIQYCQKEETRNGNIYRLGIPKPLRILKKEDLFPFQKNIIKTIDKDLKCEDDRTINWFWEPNGGIGKTKLAKYICFHYNAIFVSGSEKDIKCAVAAHILKHGELDVCIFHFVRTVTEETAYGAIEAIKDGIFFSGKYESGMVNFNPPCVICLSNFEPDITTLTSDRWKIEKLNVESVTPFNRLSALKSEPDGSLKGVTEEEIICFD